MDNYSIATSFQAIHPHSPLKSATPLPTSREGYYAILTQEPNPKCVSHQSCFNYTPQHAQVHKHFYAPEISLLQQFDWRDPVKPGINYASSFSPNLNYPSHIHMQAHTLPPLDHGRGGGGGGEEWSLATSFPAPFTFKQPKALVLSIAIQPWTQQPKAKKEGLHKSQHTS